MTAEEAPDQTGEMVDIPAEVDKLYGLYRGRTNLIYSTRAPEELLLQQLQAAWDELWKDVRKLPCQEKAVARLEKNFNSDSNKKLIDEDDDELNEEVFSQQPLEKDGLEQLFNIDAHGKTYFNEKVLDDLCRQIGHRKVAVISTAGKFRQGKTFWTNVLLRGLRRGDARFEADEEIGGKDGIHFKMGYDAHTKGIMVWPEVYSRKIDGEDVAVILLDTQGTFDTETDTKISAVIFAISLLMSSTQILNVKGFIGSNDLDALNVFLEFSRGESDRPGQDFALLLRDIPDEHRDGKIYGVNRSYLDDLKKKTGQIESLKQLVKGMEDAFQKVECCLVPGPTDAVLDASSTIRAGDCGQNFLGTLSSFANHILTNLQPKIFRESALTGDILREYVQNLCTTIKSKECRREIASAFDATVNLYSEKALAAGFSAFNASCDQFARESHYQAVCPKIFESTMEDFKRQAEEAYNGITRFGGASLKQQQFAKFSASIQDKIDDRVRHNNERYKDTKIANAVNDSYNKYEKMMKPDLLSQLEGEKRIKHVQGQHEEARRVASLHFESEIIEFGGEPVVVEKRETLKRMIEDRFEDLQANNAIQGVQEMAREIVDKSAHEFQTMLAESLPTIIDDISKDLVLTKARSRIDTVFALHVQKVISNPVLAKVDPKTIGEFLENYKKTHLEAHLRKEEAHFLSQTQLVLASKATEKKIAEMQKKATEAEEMFNRERDEHEKRMQHNEQLIDDEKKRSEKLIEEAKEDVAFRKKMQEMRLEFEMKKEENERLAEQNKHDRLMNLEEKRLQGQQDAANRRAEQADEQLKQAQRDAESRSKQHEKQMEQEKEFRLKDMQMAEQARKEKRADDERKEQREHLLQMKRMEADSIEKGERLQREHEVTLRELERQQASDAKETARIEAERKAKDQQYELEKKRIDDATKARELKAKVEAQERATKEKAEKEAADNDAKERLEAIRASADLERTRMELADERSKEEMAASKAATARANAQKEEQAKHEREMEEKRFKEEHKKWYRYIF